MTSNLFQSIIKNTLKYFDFIGIQHEQNVFDKLKNTKVRIRKEMVNLIYVFLLIRSYKSFTSNYIIQRKHYAR